MKAILTDTDNDGFILRLVDAKEVSGQYHDEVHAFQDVEPLHALQAALWQLIEYFGCGGGRHDMERLHIRIIHGDKFDCPGCSICSAESA